MYKKEFLDIINTTLLKCIETKNSSTFIATFKKYAESLISEYKRCYLSKCFILLNSDRANKELYEIVKTIVRSGETGLEQSPKDTVLHAAAQLNLQELVEFIITETTLTANSCGLRNMTPLFHAYSKNNFEMCSLLIGKFGANPFIPLGEDLEKADNFYLNMLIENSKPTSLDHAQKVKELIAQCHQVISLKTVIKKEVFAKIIRYLALQGLHDEMKLFVQRSPKWIDSKYDGDTALMCATARKHEKCVALLLENGASPKQFCMTEAEKEMTPYGLAAMMGYLDILSMFMPYAQVDEIAYKIKNKKDMRFYSALLIAIDVKQAESVEFLLGRGAEPNQTDNAKASCLNLALDNLARALSEKHISNDVYTSHIRIITLLLVNGAMPDDNTYMLLAENPEIFMYIPLEKIFFNMAEQDYIIKLIDIINERCSKETLNNIQLTLEWLKKISSNIFGDDIKILKKIDEVIASLEQKLKQETGEKNPLPSIVTTSNFFPVVTGRNYLLKQGFSSEQIKSMQQEKEQPDIGFLPSQTLEKKLEVNCYEWGCFLNSSLENILPLGSNCFILFPEKALSEQGCKDLSHFKKLAETFKLSALRKLVDLKKEKIFKAGNEEYLAVGYHEIGNYRKARIVVYELQQKANNKTLYIAGEYIPEGFHVGSAAKQWKGSDKIIDISQDVMEEYNASNLKEEIVYKPG